MLHLDRNASNLDAFCIALDCFDFDGTQNPSHQLHHPAGHRPESTDTTSRVARRKGVATLELTTVLRPMFCRAGLSAKTKDSATGISSLEKEQPVGQNGLPMLATIPSGTPASLEGSSPWASGNFAETASNWLIDFSDLVNLYPVTAPHGLCPLTRLHAVFQMHEGCHMQDTLG